MKKKQNFLSPFGNKVPSSSLISANFTYNLCRLLFGRNNKPLNPCVVSKGEVNKDFGMLTIVDGDFSTDARNDKVYDARNDKVYDARKHMVSLSNYDDECIDCHADKSARNDGGENAVIIGTIRMGFGHWRMAIAMASAAHHLGYTPYLLDLMSFEKSTAQKSIRFLEWWYNKFSRLSQSFPLFNTLIWEKATSRRDITSCVRERVLSQLFVPCFENLPKNIPLLSMHPWIGHAAVMAGMKNVVSIVPDNFPMSFWLVEGSRHTVQSPSAYMGYRTLLSMDKKYEITKCLDENTIKETGHYVDYEIVSTIDRDCDLRLERMKNGEPRRFLLTMGGAGAQAKRFADIIKFCKNNIDAKKATFLVNMGDHKGRWQKLKAILEKNHIFYELHTDWEATKKFASDALHNSVSGIHIFLHDDFYAAVYLTNLLLHSADIMITKPSELSFYPIPKLFIQRVGRHEAWGAIRGSEIGDGTIETSGKRNLHRTLRTLINSNDLLELYIRHIKKNNASGIYDGAENAVKWAVSSE